FNTVVMKTIKLSTIFFICLFLVNPLFGQANANIEGNAGQDSVRVYPEKMPDKTTWEKIVSFPGTLLYLPLKLIFIGTEETVTYVQESEKLAKLRQMLIPKVRIRGVLPAYSIRSGVGLKYYYNDIIGEGSKLTVSTKAGFVDNRQKHYIRLRDMVLGNNFVSTMFFQYRYLTRESFFGIGSNSDFEAISSYALEKTTAQVHLGYRINSKATLNAFAQFEQNGVFAGRDKDDPLLTEIPSDSLPGLGTRIKMGTLGFSLILDSRNLPGRATAGWEVALSGSISDQISRNDFKYWKFMADVKRYVHLFYNRTLVFRIAAERMRPLSGNEIPFFYLSELGRRETIRGFTRGRFRDNDMLLASIEYRYPIWHYFDAVLYCDAGQVSPDLTDTFAFDNFKFGFGGGIRVHSSRGLVLKLEIGVSTDRTRFYGVLNE
ncbi:MAG: BamA/TamA family outer membrane protein, partial [bacterium]